MARSRRWRLTFLGVAALVFSVAWWRERAADAPPAQVDPSELEGTSPAFTSSSGGSSPGGEALPGSLRGTEVDGALAVGADGRLIVGPDAVRLFDYFLATTGEEPAAAVRARIVAHARRALPPDAAAEAVALLDRYLAYRERMRALATGDAAPSDLERRLQWVRELRREVFGAEIAEALFGQEEEVVRVDLERRRLAEDASLAPQERAARMQALEEQLPESIRDARRRATAPQRVRAEVDALRAAGGNDADVFALREAAFGRAAAERLAALDAERARWNARLASYTAARDAIAADSKLAPGERRDAIDRLRSARFDAREELRVRALEEAASAAESARSEPPAP